MLRPPNTTTANLMKLRELMVSDHERGIVCNEKGPQRMEVCVLANLARVLGIYEGPYSWQDTRGSQEHNLLSEAGYLLFRRSDPDIVNDDFGYKAVLKMINLAIELSLPD